MYIRNIPMMAVRCSPAPNESINRGAYRPNLSTVRQNGSIIATAKRSLSRLCFTLASRFTLSFHLSVQAIRDGNIFTILPRRRMTMSTEISARMSKSISIASFCLISHFLEKSGHSVAEITLDGDFSVFCTSAHSALHFKSAS